MFLISSPPQPPSCPKTAYCIKEDKKVTDDLSLCLSSKKPPSKSYDSEPIFEASKKLYNSKKHQELTRLYARCDENARKRSIENFWAYVSQYSKRLSIWDKKILKNLLLHIDKHIPLYDDVLIYAMSYWDNLNFSYDLIMLQQPYPWLNFLIATLCLADKYIGNEEPGYPSTSLWADISNLSPSILSKFEKIIWLKLNCNLNISSREYKLYRTYLTQ